MGYRQLGTKEENADEVDLLSYLDDAVQLSDVKSMYIRSTTHEVWLHRTNTLGKPAWQLRRNWVAVLSALMANQDFG